MSHSTRKPTLLTLRRVSTRIRLSMPCRLTWTNTFRLLLIFCFMNHYSIPLRRNVSGQISLRGLRMLIFVDTLRRVHYVGFLVERLIYKLSLNAFGSYYHDHVMFATNVRHLKAHTQVRRVLWLNNVLEKSIEIRE